MSLPSPMAVKRTSRSGEVGTGSLLSGVNTWEAFSQCAGRGPLVRKGKPTLAMDVNAIQVNLCSCQGGKSSV